MKTVDRYVLIETLRPFAVTLLLAFLVLVLERLLRIIDLVLGVDGPLRLLAQMLTYLMPQFIGLALPLGFFIGVLLGFRRLSRDSELDALQASGIGLPRLLMPVMMVAVIVVAVAALTIGYLQPYSRYAYRAMVHTLTGALIQAVLEEGAFTHLDGTTFLAEKTSADGRNFLNVFLYRDRDGGWSATTARQGRLMAGQIGRPPVLLLKDGITLTGDFGGYADEEQGVGGVLKFSDLRTPIGDAAGAAFRPRGEDERELSLLELWEQRLTPPNGVSGEEMHAEFHGRLTRIVSVLALPVLALSLAHGYRRRARSFGVAIGVAVLIAYREVLDFGENLVQAGAAGAFVGLWLPAILFFAICITVFLWKVRHVPRGAGLPLPPRLAAAFSRPLAGEAAD